MDALEQLLHLPLAYLIRFGRQTMLAIGMFETWLRGLLSPLGLSASTQSLLLLCVGVLLIIVAVQAFARIVRAGIVLFLLLLTVHLLQPVFDRLPPG